MDSHLMRALRQLKLLEDFTQGSAYDRLKTSDRLQYRALYTIACALMYVGDRLDAMIAYWEDHPRR